MREIKETELIQVDDYKIYVIQHNKRDDGCDFSLNDSPPTCSKQDVVAVFKAERPKFGGINVGPGVIGQLDVMLDLLKQQFPNAKFEGTAEQENLLQFVSSIIVKQRFPKKLYLATINTGELEPAYLPFCTA